MRLEKYITASIAAAIATSAAYTLMIAIIASPAPGVTIFAPICTNSAAGIPSTATISVYATFPLIGIVYAGQENAKHHNERRCCDAYDKRVIFRAKP